MTQTLRDLDDEFFFDSESRSLAFHQMRKPTAADVAALAVLAAVAFTVYVPFALGGLVADGIAKLTGRA